MPTAFVSYSWDPEPHPTWVRELAHRLRIDRVDAKLDKWIVRAGDDLPHFMERAIRENDHVLVVCTPSYKKKSDARLGGVGYEGGIMTGEAFVLQNRRKFIPILREGEWKDAAPSWLLGSYYVDLRGSQWEDRYRLLLDTIHRRLPEPPPVQAQGFRQLPDETVLDTTTNLIWANCRSTDLAVLEEVPSATEALQQSTGWAWRLPSDEEVEKVRADEEYYPRPPIVVEVSLSHPSLGSFKKGPWTAKLCSNVRRSDRAISDAGHHTTSSDAAEAESLRRRFLLRLVRDATPEDRKSVVGADDV